jgi:hypothetical protein
MLRVSGEAIKTPVKDSLDADLLFTPVFPLNLKQVLLSCKLLNRAIAFTKRLSQPTCQQR